VLPSNLPYPFTVNNILSVANVPPGHKNVKAFVRKNVDRFGSYAVHNSVGNKVFTRRGKRKRQLLFGYSKKSRHDLSLEVQRVQRVRAAVPAAASDDFDGLCRLSPDLRKLKDQADFGGPKSRSCY